MMFYVPLGLLILGFVATSQAYSIKYVPKDLKNDKLGPDDFFLSMDDLIELERLAKLTAEMEDKDEGFSIGVKILLNDQRRLQIKTACEKAKRDYEFYLKQEEGLNDHWKIVPEISGQSYAEPFHQLLLHCGRIMLPIKIPERPDLGSFEGVKPWIFQLMCDLIAKDYDSVTKNERKPSSRSGLWKLVTSSRFAPANSTKEGRIAIALNCGFAVKPTWTSYEIIDD